MIAAVLRRLMVRVIASVLIADQSCRPGKAAGHLFATRKTGGMKRYGRGRLGVIIESRPLMILLLNSARYRLGGPSRGPVGRDPGCGSCHRGRSQPPTSVPVSSPRRDSGSRRP